FSPVGERVLACEEGTGARVYDAVTGAAQTPRLRHDAAIRHAAFSPDGRQVVVATQNGKIVVWNAAGGRRVAERGGGGECGRVARARPGAGPSRPVARGGRAGLGAVPRAGRGAPPLDTDLPVHTVAFSADGKRAVTAAQSISLKVWDAATGAPLGPRITEP